MFYQSLQGGNNKHICQHEEISQTHSTTALQMLCHLCSNAAFPDKFTNRILI